MSSFLTDPSAKGTMSVMFVSGPNMWIGTFVEETEGLEGEDEYYTRGIRSRRTNGGRRGRMEEGKERESKMSRKAKKTDTHLQ